MSSLTLEGHTGAVKAMAVVLAAGVMTVAGCGSDVVATGYREENREAFLTACTVPGEDDRLVRDICECTYEQIRNNMAFADFVLLEESLRIDALSPVPDAVAGYMADCFMSEVDL